MKLKGLVWFFAIALILISIWELSYTFVVRSYEAEVKAKAEKIFTLNRRHFVALAPDLEKIIV